MISIEHAKRLIKRAILANVTCEKEGLFITPLISGKHGIGKSAIVKDIAAELGGVCITIEGGTLKEGEITGIPYQYEDKNGVRFKFLPYYAIERIQQEERRLFEVNRSGANATFLDGDENRYSQNDIPASRKIELLKNGEIRPVIVFIDEINRTDSAVYKELMNILLTKTVNGYRLPWWAFFVGAMNPSTQNSIYATNEMDPAQLDRFLKLKIEPDINEWLAYASSHGVSENITAFLKENPSCLSKDSAELEDEENPTPSPRGWDMINTIMTSEPYLRPFFTENENSAKTVSEDLQALANAKLGPTVATMFFASLAAPRHALTANDIFSDDDELSNTKNILHELSIAKKVQTCDSVLDYLQKNAEFLMLRKSDFKKKKAQLSALVSQLDSSTKLLFAQKIAATKTDDGNNLMDFVFDAFESDLLETLDLTDRTRQLLEQPNHDQQ